MSSEVVTVFVNVSKAAPKFFFAGALHPTQEAAEQSAKTLKDCIGTFPITVPLDALK